MWIASKFGFFSVVLKDGHHHVRARREEDLRALVAAHPRPEDCKIDEWPAADYRFRIRIPEGNPAFGELMGILAASADYPNFKSAIAANPSQRHKLDAYHRIWSIMADLQK